MACDLLDGLKTSKKTPPSYNHSSVGHATESAPVAETPSRGLLTGARKAPATALDVRAGKNVFRSTPSTEFTQTVQVNLPADRCKSGTMTFGPVDGKQITCSVLGRGVTRWNWGNKAPSKHSFTCMGKNSWVHTTASDWQKGETSTGQSCFFLKSHKRCGATPVGTYSTTSFSSSRSSWGSLAGVVMYPRFKSSRSGIVTHSDANFGSSPFIESPGHSTAGCLKLEPSCQKLYLKFVESNKRNGLKLQVNEI
jgi:hypothetical protein